MHIAAHAYLQTQVTTTNQADILLMLYSGAIKFLNSAKERIAAKDPAGKGILISKALDIINELDSTLNMERGGELAKNLHSLYDFCSRRLLMANLRQSSEIIDEVIKVLSGLRGAYEQIVDNPEAKLAAEEAGRRAAAQSTRTQSAPAPVEQPVSAAPGMGRHALSSYGKQNVAEQLTAPAQPEEPAIVAPLSATGESAAESTAAKTPTTDSAVPAQSLAEPVPPRLGANSVAGLNLYKKFGAPRP